MMHIAYKGTNYHGWQRQANANSVQEVIESALLKILKHKAGVTGCGRTDTGVHARNYYLHFDTEEFIPDKIVSNLPYRLNRLLPEDIAVFNMLKVSENFHARFSAIRRTYKYYISRDKKPFMTDVSWLYTHSLDIKLMNAASEMIIGQKDFSCFAKLHSDTKNNICNIHNAAWEESGNMLVFNVTADRFLRNMVRAMVGTLLDVGKKKISKKEFSEILKSGNRSLAGESVPAHGLFLEAVEYPPLSAC